MQTIEDIITYSVPPGSEEEAEYKKILVRAFPTAGKEFPSLKALSKIKIRKILYDNYQLPIGIDKLFIY